MIELIRPYVDADERGWVECRVLAFLDSAYYDAVDREKEHYERPSVELVAEVDGRIVGLIDVEYEEEPATVCEDRPGLGGMIWHIAVLRDFRRQGIASRLLAYYDAVDREKEHYERPSIELVAEVDGTIVGLIDVECEEEPGTSARTGRVSAA